MRWLLLAFAALAAAPAPAAAQEPETPPTGAIVYGPFQLRPSIALRDVGVDNNVFNESDNPRSDFTFTVTPRAGVRFRMRRIRVGLLTAVDYVYYRTYASERGTNTSGSLRVDFDLGRLRPYLLASGVNTQQRLNAEVDERARHRDTTYGGGLSLQVASRTRLRLNAEQTTTSFEEGEAFRGADLRESFDNRRTNYGGGFSIDLSALTSFDIIASHEEQSFVFSPDRDSTTWRFTPGLTFSTDGLLRGAASVGYRHFHTLSPDLPDYSGLVSAISIAATIYGRHELEGVLNRDVQYSYDEATDYYLGTNASLTWTVQVKGPFDVRGTGARSNMDYRGATVDAGHDLMYSYGGGIGYRFATMARLGLNADWTRRTSDRSEDRTYRNHRIFATLTWGPTQ